MSAMRKPIYGLDIVRLAAAVLVTAYHLAFTAFALPKTFVSRFGPTGLLPAWWRLTWWGWVGVQIFFVISGTVIAYSMAGASPATFFRKRVERLYPALLICATLALPVAIIVYGTTPAAALPLYLRTILFHPSGPWLLGQFWTLPMEAIFYGMMWLVLLAGRQDHLSRIAWAFAIVSASFWTLQSAGVPMPNGRLTALLLMQHGCYFALGIHLAQPAAARAHITRILLPLVTIATAAVQIHATASVKRVAHELGPLWIIPFMAWLLAIGAIFASIRYRAAIAAHLERSAGRLRLMGRVTYPLYLIHMHAGGAVLVGLLLANASVPVAVAGALLASGVAAWAIARYIEPPAHRALAVLLRGRLARRLRLA